MSQKSGFEIERKFLIAMPSIKLLLAQNGTTVWKIEQTYLKNGGRVRKIFCDNKDTYIKTVKQRITDIKRIEKEWEITKEQYENELLGKADDRVTIEKTRYRIPFKGQILEVDIFPFYTDRAFL